MEDSLYVCEVLGLYIRDAGALDSALARPASVVWGDEAYEGIHMKGAALLDGINRSHPLLDGNKRLSWTMVDAFYSLNGLRLTVDPGEGDEFVRAVGGDHIDLEQIATWLEEHSSPAPEATE
ncbi:type II toxin-antitoxin system death-on-curing family toxin [Cellulomonas sp. Leaf334]|uniref:type II toxin-antitoxin system death-on-curing family toxin n=1 Tax=Cellulomonas sp. Leaf334 TaxID=1736339 RepID=UPI0012E1F2FD|nr:Fic family protein [Cellulomonas sp. Leaf334]